VTGGSGPEAGGWYRCQSMDGPLASFQVEAFIPAAYIYLSRRTRQVVNGYLRGATFHGRLVG
jgi:hypothetical protein